MVAQGLDHGVWSGWESRDLVEGRNNYPSSNFSYERKTLGVAGVNNLKLLNRHFFHGLSDAVMVVNSQGRFLDYNEVKLQPRTISRHSQQFAAEAYKDW